MAQLTLTVPDAVVPRIREAFGRTHPETGERISATVSELQTALRSYIKGVVLEYEVAKQAKVNRDVIGREDWNG